MIEVLILAAHGPEVRLIVHSGLLCALRERGARVSLVTRQPNSKAWHQCELGPRPWPAVDRESGLLSILRWRARRSSSAAFFRATGHEGWRHYLPSQRGDNSDRRPLCPSLQAPLFRAAESMWSGLATDRTGWREAIGEADIIVMVGHSSPWAVAALHTAGAMGRLSVLLVNSWKDLAVCPHFAAAPGLVLTWNPLMAQAYRKAVGTRRRVRISCVGSLHTASVFARRGRLSQEQFCNRCGLDAGRPFVLYSAASPNAVDREEEVVSAIMELMASSLPEVQLLVRTNPMEDGSRFFGLLARREGLRIQKPLWEWDEENDWCCCLPEDLDQWAGALSYGACNVSVPSTVTLECAVFGQPVVNIGFDADSVPPERSCTRFWMAPFYRAVRESGFARLATSPEQAVMQIGERISAEHQKTREEGEQLVRGELGDWTPKAAERAADEILGLAG